MTLRMFEWGIIKGFEGLSHLFHQEDGLKRQSASQITLGTVAHPYDPDKFEKAMIDAQTRCNHLYILGSTGSGKTKLIEFMVRQDISKGNGFMAVDPHGDLTKNILAFLARKFRPSELDELGQRLILIEPFDRNWAVGFNPVQAIGAHFPVTLELMEIFRRFWGNTYWGPRMDELLRNAILTISQNGLSLLEVRPLLTNQGFRQRLIENVSFAEVRDYWRQRYNPLSDRMQSLYREAVLNKVSAFVADPAIYRIVGQRENTINFPEAMDHEKWVLLNLSKGQLKDNLRLLGSLFLAKLKHAALSRVDLREEDRRPFNLFVDEFQNFVGSGFEFEEVLSEARKYRLGLTIAHQNLDQLTRELKSTILGNVGAQAVFRTSHTDASQISSEMDPKQRTAIERKLVDLGPREALLKIKGQKPRVLKTEFVRPAEASDEEIKMVKDASFRYWARPVDEVEREIEERRRPWMDEEASVRPQSKRSKVTSIKDYPSVAPEDLFEEGQNEW